ncbi:unconventional myosin-XVIIIa isoform X6 [Anthonomus grandis grandis]|uniref:unconventional myosin-XVIIIa isoform X6 n=1 Tax=Anthonomus grandis grandis TaxID=2921223 RepID=UPI0021665827|nr:unconventional myosin-XVIIIa isoform X6 [Anthonomus grandis grandis]
MSSGTQKPKYMGKPFIKKIYETHKKWLGGESKKNDALKKNSLTEIKKVPTTDFDVTVEDDKPSSDFDSIQSDKLRIVINSFDKILDEYSSISSNNSKTSEDVPVTVVEVIPPKSDTPPVPAKRHSLPKEPVVQNTDEPPITIVPPPRRHSTRTPQKLSIVKPISQDVSLSPTTAAPKTPNTKIPKLVKAKTCSIIESKCILKKTNSTNNPGQPNHLQGNLPGKTKSMNNLDLNAPTPTKIVPITIESPKYNKKNLFAQPEKKKVCPEVPPKPIPLNSTFDVPKKTPIIDSPIKVKDLVKRLNSLTETVVPEIQVQPPPISKAVSTTNLSLSKKHGSTSKIPVNSSLRKSFPSTPCHLDKIDNSGSTLVKEKQNSSMSKSKSTQNLAKPRFSLPVISNGLDKPVSRAKSVQNIAKQRISLAKPIEHSDKNLGKSVPDLLKGKTRQTKAPIKPKSLNENTNKGNPVNKLKALEVKKAAPVASKSSPKLLREKSKPNLKANLTVVKPKPNVKAIPLDKVDGCAKNLAKKTELLLKMKTEEDVDPKQAFVAIKGPKDKKVNIVVKKIEDHSEVSLNKVARSQTLKKVETNGISTVEKKLVTDTKQTKPTLRKISPKVESQRNKSILDTKGDDKFISKKKFTEVNGLKKHLDYNSDNSDDSGNISNEVDCDEVNSTSSIRSRTSTESLTTVLDATINPTSKDLSVKSCEVSIVKNSAKQIFFRTGVVSQLESQRDERLAGVVISLQAHCRGYLARRKLQQRKLQDLAVRCIQRNVRKFMLVRDWPWWRLLVRVTPLLNVHRTEEELRAKTDELEALKQKLQKIELERIAFKNDNDLLEAKLSEMTADLAEEHSTATLAAERLDAETSERLRLEKELSESKHRNKELQQSSERLELELLYARSDLNGISEEDEDGNDGDGVYKQRYERALKELEFTKRRLQQQHEDDLEQLVGLKKQLEKKLSDAYEEVEEQRQVVGTWKRKVQKLTGEMNDLKLMLEEQSSRNNLLEKKQRKYDSEAALLHDELKKEKQYKDRLSREKELIMAEKYAKDSELADVKLELELKEERLACLQREFDEVTCGGKTEEEVTVLRKQKIDCERKMQDQEEELDELAGQVQLLEQAKLRLEMTLESMRKEAKKTAQLQEEELEEVRCNAQKKVKALEQQLENEHEERTILLREKHELERRLQSLADADRQDRAGDEALLQRLKRDLKRTKALLRDTQAQLERQKAETPGKNMIRQLRNQLDDLECARAIALKTKQSLEQELSEMQALLEEAHKQKAEAEDRANAMQREKSDIQTQLEENEEELAEVLKKYKAAVQQMSVDQMTLQEQVSIVSELEVERNHLKEQLAELTSKLESAESMGGASSNLLYRRAELKVKELESKLDLEQTTRSRLEVQIARLKENVEKLQSDITSSRIKEQQAQDEVRKLQRHARELKEELNKSLAKESEVIIKKKDLEKRCESLEAECSSTRAELRLALKRIEDLQSAIQGELEDSISNESDSDEDSYGSDESVNTFLANHKLASPVKSEKSSIANDARRLSSSTSRSSTSSNLGKDSSYA